MIATRITPAFPDANAPETAAVRPTARPTATASVFQLRSLLFLIRFPPSAFAVSLELESPVFANASFRSTGGTRRPGLHRPPSAEPPAQLERAVPDAHQPA